MPQGERYMGVLLTWQAKEKQGSCAPLPSTLANTADIHRCRTQLAQQAADTLLGLLRHSWQSCRWQPENLSNDSSSAAAGQQQVGTAGHNMGSVTRLAAW